MSNVGMSPGASPEATGAKAPSSWLPQPRSAKAPPKRSAEAETSAHFDPYHGARPMGEGERFVETLRFLEDPSEDPLVWNAGPFGHAMPVDMSPEFIL